VINGAHLKRNTKLWSISILTYLFLSDLNCPIHFSISSVLNWNVLLLKATSNLFLCWVLSLSTQNAIFMLCLRHWHVSCSNSCWSLLFLIIGWGKCWFAINVSEITWQTIVSRSWSYKSFGLRWTISHTKSWRFNTMIHAVDSKAHLIWCCVLSANFTMVFMRAWT